MTKYPYAKHDDGIVLTQPEPGVFKDTPMTPAELAARDPALVIAKDIYRHANQAGVCYYELWLLISKAIQGVLDAPLPELGKRPRTEAFFDDLAEQHERGALTADQVRQQKDIWAHGLERELAEKDALLWTEIRLGHDRKAEGFAAGVASVSARGLIQPDIEDLTRWLQIYLNLNGRSYELADAAVKYIVGQATVRDAAAALSAIAPSQSSGWRLEIEWALVGLQLAVNGLKSRRELVETDDPTTCDPELWNIRSAMKNIEAALAAAPTEIAATHGWIKCIDRLPEPNVPVLVSVANYGMTTDELTDSGDWANFGDEPCVTHWQSLPAAPAEGGQP